MGEVIEIGRHRVHHGDCLDVMATLPDNSVDAIVTDPPYYRVKDSAWDKTWENPARFLGWISDVVAQFHRLLKPNGSLYLFASPQMSTRVELVIAERFNVLNRIALRKTSSEDANNGLWSRADKDTLRAFFPQKEEIIFAEHYGADNIAKGEAGYAAKCDELRGFVFEPLRAYLAEEMNRSGHTLVSVNQAWQAWKGGKGGMSSHWFTTSQWALPTEANYTWLRALFNSAGSAEYLRRDYEDLRRDYEDLRRDYEDLRRDYEDLRRPFQVSADVPYTDVWDFQTVPSYPGKHECEKPQALIQHIIAASTRADAVVLDAFAGSASTGVACVVLGRRFIGIEQSAHWVDFARHKLAVPPDQIEQRLRPTQTSSAPHAQQSLAL